MYYQRYITSTFKNDILRSSRRKKVKIADDSLFPLFHLSTNNLSLIFDTQSQKILSEILCSRVSCRERKLKIVKSRNQIQNFPFFCRKMCVWVWYTWNLPRILGPIPRERQIHFQMTKAMFHVEVCHLKVWFGWLRKRTGETLVKLLHTSQQWIFRIGSLLTSTTIYAHIFTFDW